MTTAPEVTLVVVPRQRFHMTRRSLDSVYDKTTFPFALIYVDGGTPVTTRRYLEGQAHARGFRLVRTDLMAGSSPVMRWLRARDASAPVRDWGGSVGSVRSGRVTSVSPVIDVLFISPSRMRRVRTRQPQARR